ncbi:glutamine-dependent NAD(+) synthetase, putative (NADSYN) [Plasmodium ovale wallikeri]|uniref:Glutamine-dependent NAD(+) synthetase, putative (NADSYN) n=1 Tax=Plasmodium ovale wallikeri TaxID=864142 RepID=A0A1A8YR51_PLAOA|nr:glutamine-dependent NAD(+) synthetase, putative (NADSYN) [Plasmodium ovale wallikeri]
MANGIGLSCCSISSFTLGYEENTEKIVESIRNCKKLNCDVRFGGELEMCGVNCKSSFKEIEDIHENCWFYLSTILKEKYENEKLTENILCFISMPVYFKKKLYSCQVVIYNNVIVCISPKGNICSHEVEYFTPYCGEKMETINSVTTPAFGNSIDKNIHFLHQKFETFPLPKCIREVTNQKETYIGRGSIQLGEVTISHLFLDDLIEVESNSIIDDRVSVFNETGNRSIDEGDDKLPPRDDCVGETNPCPFDKECVRMHLRRGIDLKGVDVLLVSGYVPNELQLFRRYFTELMELTKMYPNMILSFSNNSGCDNYLYTFDGFSFISQNNKILTKNARFSFAEVQVASVHVSLEERGERGERGERMSYENKDVREKHNTFAKIEQHRINKLKCLFSFNREMDLFVKASNDILSKNLPYIFNLQMYGRGNNNLTRLFKNYHYNEEKKYMYEFNSDMYLLHNIYEELTFNCALFLWHILHMTNAKGFILALSGGIDSAFCACMVYFLSIMIETQLKINGVSNEGIGILREGKTLNEKIFCKKVTNLMIEKACRMDINNKLLNTISMPSKNSSDKTKFFSDQLSKCINSYHIVYNIDDIFNFFKNIGENFLKEEMKFKSQGGSNYHDLCLQNIQSRCRMLLVYFFSTLISHKKYFTRNMHNEFLITLATGNLDESITGYYTKYDCSSGDIDIIGNVSKILIKETMCYISSDPLYNLNIVNDINAYHPSAELKPLDNNQTDENELNLKYVEIKLLTILKNNFFLGPSSMFYYLYTYFWHYIPKVDIYNKVKIFFTRILKNTHKLFILPPSLRNESCGLHHADLVHVARLGKGNHT